ncbi:hypothetical protein M2157_000238 [Streptomyces sp. SAI-127]|nr:hypothetical protein [Streptomyces sp. SAI-127]
MHVSLEDPDVVWMCECFADEAAFERAVSLVRAEVTKRLHELCIAGTEVYRLGLVAGKGLPRRLETTTRPDGQAPQAPFPPRLIMARYSCSPVSGGAGSGWARSVRKPSSRR